MLVVQYRPVNIFWPILIGVFIGMSWHYVRMILSIIMFHISGAVRLWTEHLISPGDPLFSQVIIFNRMISSIIDHAVFEIENEADRQKKDIPVPEEIILTALAYELLKRFENSNVVPSKVDGNSSTLVLMRR